MLKTMEKKTSVFDEEVLYDDWAIENDADADELWRDAMQAIKDAIGGRRVVCVGSVQRWNGICEGGRISGDLNKVMGLIFEDCSFYRICDRNGELHIYGTHHDGTNHLQVRVLTESGEQCLAGFAEGYESSSKAIERVFYSDQFSADPFVAEGVWW